MPKKTKVDVEIKVLDPVHSICIKGIDLVKPSLKYIYEQWSKGVYGKKVTKRDAFFMNAKGEFLTGLIPRIQNRCKKLNFTIKIFYSTTFEHPAVCTEPKIKGITLREDQVKLVDVCFEKERGIIQSPTGSGKTILATALISGLKKYNNILFLCHSIDLIDQMNDELHLRGFTNTSIIGGGSHDELGKITLATIQSFVKLDPNDYSDFFGAVIVDESHHVNNRTSQYAKVLMYLSATFRIGFTATPHKEKAKVLASEGLLGPIIGVLSIEEGIKKGILSKPIITLIPVKFNKDIAKNKRFVDIHYYGLIMNRQRNRLVVIEANKRIKKGKSVLCMIKDIDHGNEIKKMALAMNVDVEFVKGATGKETRLKVKKELNQKKTKFVICSVIWKEGINIPTLNTIILAYGGKSEITTLQALGRGLRTTDEKNKIEVIDFLDPYPYLSGHTVERLSVYVQNGWL